MKFNCGRTWEMRLNDKRLAAVAQKELDEQWHRVFAWLPVKLGAHDCRWLETVERKYIDVTVEYDYAMPLTMFVDGPTGYALHCEEINFRAAKNMKRLRFRGFDS